MSYWSALDAIQRCDPDGGEREPTEADYRAHQEWAVATFGPEVWRRYRAGGWGESQDANCFDYRDAENS